MGFKMKIAFENKNFFFQFVEMNRIEQNRICTQWKKKQSIIFR